MQFAPDTPAQFTLELEHFASRWRERADSEQQARLDGLLSSQPTLRDQLTRAVIGSHYLAEQVVGEPNLLLELLQTAAFEREKNAAQLQQELERALNRDDDSTLDSSLRRHRHRFMTRVIWRDLNRLATLEQTTRELSDFADACIQTVIDYHYAALASHWGVPVGESSGAIQPLLVLGMGKLGAFELNLSSDIDLIFAYPESGNTQGAVKSLSNQEFFLRLGQRLIKSLDTVTADGFVFRVDMRLRPWGQSGALASHFDALENYYQTQGREWERYAMIKARLVASNGDGLLHSLATQAIKVVPAAIHAEKLMALLRPFTYRRYLDFSAIDSLREMKNLIAREVQRKGLRGDVKLGAGGIREIEFIVQVFQLIRGGREDRLRDPRLLVVLPLLEEAHYLPSGVAAQLAAAYRFLRNTEHALQAYEDRQTQQLPSDAQHRARLAWIMGFDEWAAFDAALQRHCAVVTEQFNAVIAERRAESRDEEAAQGEWSLLWQGRLSDDAAQRFLAEQGIDDPDAIDKALRELRDNRQILAMQSTARERLDSLMPLLLGDLVRLNDPVTSLQRICGVLEAVARRSAYLVLLLENPGARAQLTKLCEASPWIAQQLATYPVLLDELLDVRTLYSPPDRAALAADLQRDVMRLAWDDLEGHMESLRLFRLSYALRVAACEVTGLLPLMKVSDHLTFLAEAILAHVLELAWRQLVARHGRPRRSQERGEEIDFVIVAYGKLGGIELGHGSDLDLVFVHDADPQLSTDGEREVDNATFYARLGQKIIHILNTQTLSGQLYEVDMRLRPSGNSGLLVSSLAALEKYQLHDAWVWEHQALVRARPVAGSPRLAGAFDDLRQRVLCQRRDLADLKAKVADMRDRMRRELGSKPGGGRFDLKQDGGGIVDIEFMVQYAVLAWAHQAPALVRYTDNIRILGCLEEAGLLAAADVNRLIEIYKTYRSTVHRLTLQGLPAVVSDREFAGERAEIGRIWQQLLG